MQFQEKVNEPWLVNVAAVVPSADLLEELRAVQLVRDER